MLNDASIRILYDGNCPICCQKIDFFKRRDHADVLRYSNIRSAEFLPEESGVSFEELEKQIHAILPDGAIVKRMDVIRAAYKEIGLGWLVAPTGWPLLRSLFDFLYAFVAKHRLFISRFLKK